ncbi:MAG: hypothetical protein JW708_05195 [Vallitaleaceae bacterium]|nr:hypothetical protein [Vallitaleaceae bacterium]
MNIKTIVDNLELEVITGNEWLEREVTHGFVGDLLSVVMGKAEEGCAWVTVQSHINIVAVAALVSAACIIVSEGFTIDEEAIAKATEEEVVLLSSKESSYEICKKLSQLGC